MAIEAPDRYTDRDTHVIKKRAGRRPALTNTREACNDNSVHLVTRETPDRYTDRDTHVIKKGLVEGQLYQRLEQHEMTIVSI